MVQACREVSWETRLTLERAAGEKITSETEALHAMYATCFLPGAVGL